MKILSLAIIFAAFAAIDSASDVNCKYSHYEWPYIGKIYYCEVQNNLNIETPANCEIGSVAGGGDDKAIGFYASKKNVKYFPRGMEKYFGNLKLININYGRLKEIHQADIKPYPNLQVLDLYQNDIEVLEEGLFDFNPELGVISFVSNKLRQIYPNIFDHLSKLTYLSLPSNVCIDVNAENKSAVQELIKKVKEKCYPQTTATTIYEVLGLKSPNEIQTFKSNLVVWKNSIDYINNQIVVVSVDNLEDFKTKTREKFENLQKYFGTCNTVINYYMKL